MHIPKSTTDKLAVLSFADALACPVPEGEFDQEKWIYVPPRYEEYRYILGTRGEKPLVCIGVNPSTAQPGALDNTLKSVDRIARFNGFDSFVMFNLYAQRATDPDDMEKELNADLHAQNLAAFEYVLKGAKEPPAVWAAWGAVIEKRSYLFDCALDMYAVGERYGAVWYSCGARSKAGHPHHPLYLKMDSPLEPFDLRSYVGSFRRPAPRASAAANIG